MISEPARAAKRALDLFAGQFASFAFLLVNSIVVARLLGPSSYGLYVLAGVLPGFLQLATRFGFTHASTRFAALYKSEGNPERAVSFVRSLSLFRILVGGSVAGSVIALSQVLSRYAFARPELATAMELGSLSLVGEPMLENVVAALQGMEKMRMAAFLYATQGFVQMTTSIGLVLAGYSYVGAITGYSLGYLVSGGLSMLYFLRFKSMSDGKGLLNDIRLAFRYSAPIYLTALLVAAISPFTYLLLSHYASNATIGFYSLASGIANAIVFLTNPMQQTVFPIYIRSLRSPEITEVFSKSTMYMSFVLVPLVILGMALSAPLLGALYGSIYSPAAVLLVLLLAPNLLVGFGGITTYLMLTALDDTAGYFVANLVQLLGYVAVSLALVRYIGVYAAILALILGNIVALLVARREVMTRAGVRVGSPRLRIYLASMISGLGVFPLLVVLGGSLIALLLGLLVFFFLLIPILALTSAVTREELALLLTSIKLRGFSRLCLLIQQYYTFFERDSDTEK